MGVCSFDMRPKNLSCSAFPYQTGRCALSFHSFTLSRGGLASLFYVDYVPGNYDFSGYLGYADTASQHAQGHLISRLCAHIQQSTKEEKS